MILTGSRRDAIFEEDLATLRFHKRITKQACCEHMSTNLLSLADLDFIRTTGVRVDDCEDLFSVLPDHRVIFTMKGLQYFKEACRIHGFNWPALRLETEADVVHFAYQLSCRMHRQELSEHDLARGGSRTADDKGFLNAICSSDMDELLRWLDEPVAPELAEVVPFPSGKNTKA